MLATISIATLVVAVGATLALFRFKLGMIPDLGGLLRHRCGRLFSGDEPMSAAKKIAFVCLHGSAKSLIAAEYLNRLSRERGLEISATTSGPEPDAEIPSNVIDGLLLHGIDARNRVPEPVTAAALAHADQIVSFGCDLSALTAPDRAIERWDDCPAVSDDFEIAWSFITGRITQLINHLGH